MADDKPTVKKRAPVRHLTLTQRAEAIALWRAGSVTLDDLCKKFKKDRSTFLRLFKEAEVEKGDLKVEVERKAKEAVEATFVDEAAELAKRIRDMKEESIKYITGIQRLAWNTIVVAQQEKRAPATYATDMKALEMAMRVFKMGREEKYILFNVAEQDNEDKPLPDLVVQELTAQDIQELHERSLMADDELGLDETLGDEDLIGEAIPDEDENERVETDE